MLIQRASKRRSVRQPLQRPHPPDQHSQPVPALAVIIPARETDLPAQLTSLIDLLHFSNRPTLQCGMVASSRAALTSINEMFMMLKHHQELIYGQTPHIDKRNCCAPFVAIRRPGRLYPRGRSAETRNQSASSMQMSPLRKTCYKGLCFSARKPPAWGLRPKVSSLVGVRQTHSQNCKSEVIKQPDGSRIWSAA